MRIGSRAATIILPAFLALFPLGAAEGSSPSGSGNSDSAKARKFSASVSLRRSSAKTSKKKKPSSSKAQPPRTSPAKPRPPAPRTAPTKPSATPLFADEEAVETESVPLKAERAFADFDLPTDNQLIFSKTDPNRFFQPTFSGRIISANFGFVRNPGRRGQYTRFHEGVDIRALQHDDEGEPADKVFAAGSGKIVYLCNQTSQSNYGKYVVIQHDLFGCPIYTLYAHLSSVNEKLETGQSIKRGGKIGVMGRTSNEFEIDSGHAHLHFEVNLMLNRRYLEWSQKRGNGLPTHGLYNGANLIGIDPIRFYQFLQINPDLSVGDFVTREPVAFRVLAPKGKRFSWIEQYPFALTKAPDENTVAYEISMTYYGLPVRVAPKTRDEISPTRQQVLAQKRYPLTFASVNELTGHGPCGLLTAHGKRWRLSAKGREWLKQLLF
ncbi:MAG: M23 family metallopeptidase [Verrucomicrobiae bacterium]|nr:M23 family metallopeptidase [Verrucomicrobiae bacterium]